METNAEGGTSHVVRLAMGGVPDLYRVEPKRALDAPEPRQIHHLPISRPGETPTTPFEWSLIRGTEPDQLLIKENLTAINRFNANATKTGSNAPNAITASLAWFGVDSTDLSKAERRILDVFAVADVLAISL